MRTAPDVIAKRTKHPELRKDDDPILDSETGKIFIPAPREVEQLAATFQAARGHHD